MSSKPTSKGAIRTVREKGTDISNVLPPVAELISDRPSLFEFVNLDGLPQKIDFRQRASQDPMPLPMPVDREGYGTVQNSPRFWATGLGDWLNAREAMSRFLVADNDRDELRILDFGCATGRFLRQCWVDRESMGLDLWGCDFARQNVDWSKRHLERDIKILLNNDNPHLPFADQYFDMVTAFSVFTHIDEFEDAWLLELRRITRIGGLLYLTIQNEATWKKVLDRPGTFQHLSNANRVAGNMQIAPELFQHDMPSERIALRMSESDVYTCNVWMSNKYVQQNWGRYFDLLHIADNAHNSFQSVVVLAPQSATPRQSRLIR